MDKRYFLIIFIAIFCLINLYVIADFSDVVGSSYADVGKYTFSLPSDFNLVNSQDSSVVINNPNNLYIAVFSLDYSDYNYTEGLENLKNSTTVNIVSMGTLNIDNISVDAVYYEDFKSNSNKSIFYFHKDNHPFRINMENFDIDNKEYTINALEDIIQSIKLNYKI